MKGIGPLKPEHRARVAAMMVEVGELVERRMLAAPSPDNASLWTHALMAEAAELVARCPPQIRGEVAAFMVRWFMQSVTACIARDAEAAMTPRRGVLNLNSN